MSLATNHPIVSVIIPAFNGAQFIANAIESTLPEVQDSLPLEILVVDDGSIDDTQAVVQTFADSVRLITRCTNGGVASARNVGIRNARGKYIALLDQDDRFLPGKLRQQIEVLESRPNAVLCHANIRTIDASGRTIDNAFLGHKSGQLPPSGWVASELFRENFVLACTAVMRRDAVLALEGFNERLWGTDDYELWLRLAMTGEFLFVDKVLSEYRWHSSNASRNEARMALGRLKARDEFLKSCPSAWDAIGKSDIAKRMAGYAADFSYPLYTAGQSTVARELLRIGLFYSPLNPRLWKMYVATYFHGVFSKNRNRVEER